MRFNSHLISIWHRYAFKQKSIDNLLQCVLTDLPEELRPKDYFYKEHSSHAGFKAPPNFQVLKDSIIKRAQEVEDATADPSVNENAKAPVPEETTA